MRLFEIATEFRELRDLVENDLEFDEETGEVIDNQEVLVALFGELQLSLSDKLDNAAYVIDELLNGAAGLKAEAKRLNERARHYENNAEKLKALMAFALTESGEPKLKTDKHTFSFRKSEQVEIDELVTPDDFDRRYIRIKREFDKTKIKKALKDGEEIEGAALVEKQNFQIK
jgi:hypothetical protein